MPFCLAKSTTPLLMSSKPGWLGDDDDDLALGAGPHGGLRAAEARVVRAHVHGRVVRAGEAGLVDAGDDQVEALLGVVVLVDAAVDDAGVADEAEHLVLLDELRGQRRDLLRVDLLGLGDVLDRPAVDAAVVVDAVEVRLRHAGDPREVDAGHVGGDAAELDRVTGGLLAGAHAALARRLDVARHRPARAAAAGGGAAGRRWWRPPRSWSRPPPWWWRRRGGGRGRRRRLVVAPHAASSRRAGSSDGQQ